MVKFIVWKNQLNRTRGTGPNIKSRIWWNWLCLTWYPMQVPCNVLHLLHIPMSNNARPLRTESMRVPSSLVQCDFFSMTYLPWLKLVKQKGLTSKYLSTFAIIIVMFCATNHAQKTALMRGLFPFAMQSQMVCFCPVVFLKNLLSSFNTLIVHISHVLWPIFIKLGSK